MLCPGSYFIVALQKQAYSNTCILKILPQKKWKFSDTNFDIFLFLLENIDYGYSIELPQEAGSNEYPQSLFWASQK